MQDLHVCFSGLSAETARHLRHQDLDSHWTLMLGNPASWWFGWVSALVFFSDGVPSLIAHLPIFPLCNSGSYNYDFFPFDLWELQSVTTSYQGHKMVYPILILTIWVLVMLSKGKIHQFMNFQIWLTKPLGGFWNSKISSLLRTHRTSRLTVCTAYLYVSRSHLNWWELL